MRHDKGSIDRYFDNDFHLEGRLIWMGSSEVETKEGLESGTDAVMAERLIKAMDILEMGPRAQDPITIRMNNVGGFFGHGMAIFDRIRNCKAHVTIEALGYCTSMGAVILQAADTRLLYPGVQVMIHDGQDGFEGHSRNLEAAGRESAKIRHNMYRIFAERSGKPVGYWGKKCVVDYFMSPEEAVREGLADSIIYPAKAVEKKLVKRKAKAKKR